MLSQVRDIQAPLSQVSPRLGWACLEELLLSSDPTLQLGSVRRAYFGWIPFFHRARSCEAQLSRRARGVVSGAGVGRERGCVPGGGSGGRCSRTGGGAQAGPCRERGPGSRSAASPARPRGRERERPARPAPARPSHRPPEPPREGRTPRLRSALLRPQLEGVLCAVLGSSGQERHGASGEGPA